MPIVPCFLSHNYNALVLHHSIQSTPVDVCFSKYQHRNHVHVVKSGVVEAILTFNHIERSSGRGAWNKEPSTVEESICSVHFH